MSEFDTFIFLQDKWIDASDRIIYLANIYFEEIHNNNPKASSVAGSIIQQMVSAFKLLDRDISPVIERILETYLFEEIPGDMLITLNNRMSSRIKSIEGMADSIEEKVLSLADI